MNRTTVYCDSCKKKIGDNAKAIVVVPPNYEILLGVNAITYLHKRCAAKRGIDVSQVE